jgi:hypothetical protein
VEIVLNDKFAIEKGTFFIDYVLRTILEKGERERERGVRNFFTGWKVSTTEKNFCQLS